MCPYSNLLQCRRSQYGPSRARSGSSRLFSHLRKSLLVLRCINEQCVDQRLLILNLTLTDSARKKKDGEICPPMIDALYRRCRITVYCQPSSSPPPPQFHPAHHASVAHHQWCKCHPAYLPTLPVTISLNYSVLCRQHQSISLSVFMIPLTFKLKSPFRVTLYAIAFLSTSQGNHHHLYGLILPTSPRMVVISIADIGRGFR